MRAALLTVLMAWTLMAAPKISRPHLRVPVLANGDGPLRVETIRATLSGTQARVLELHGPEDGMVLVIVLDLVGDLALVDTAKQALATALQDLPENIPVALMRAQEGLRVILDPTVDRGKAAESVLSLIVSGKAGLLDTVETAARLGDSILAKANVRVGILYITDSNVYNYRQDFANPVINYSDAHDLSRRFPDVLVREKISKVVAKLTGYQTPVFVVHLDYSSEKLNEAYQNGLMQIATATGGASTICRSIPEISEAIPKMVRTMAALYSLTLELPRQLPKSVQVQLESPDRTLTYRTRFELKER